MILLSGHFDTIFDKLEAFFALLTPVVLKMWPLNFPDITQEWNITGMTKNTFFWLLRTTGIHWCGLKHILNNFEFWLPPHKGHWHLQGLKFFKVKRSYKNARHMQLRKLRLSSFQRYMTLLILSMIGYFAISYCWVVLLL